MRLNSNLNLQLHQIKALVAISETGSIRQAAKLLGRTQPTLTKSIQNLESTLEVQILRRTKQGVALTQIGQKILQRAKSVLRDLQSIEEDVVQSKGEGGGQISIGVSPVGGTLIIPRVMNAFRKKWPRVNVEIINTIAPEAFGMLRENCLDMAITPLPNADKPSACKIEKLTPLEFIVITHKANPLADATNLASIVDHEWIIHGPYNGPSSHIFGPSWPKSLPKPAPRTSCHSFSALVALVRETGAFCLLSKQLFELIPREHGLVIVPIDDNLPGLSLSLATRLERDLTPAATDFFNLVRRTVSNMP